MKRRRSLTVVVGLGLAACSRRAPDPCDPSSWGDRACEDAIAQRGYYSHGTFIPHVYPYPYPYYYGNYGTYVTRGGRVTPVSPETYARPASAGPVTRGGFGSTGEGAGGGAGE